MKKIMQKLSMLLAIVLAINCITFVNPANVNAAPKKAVKKLTISKKNVSVNIGKSVKIKYKVAKIGNASKKISVKAAKKSIAKVSVKKDTITIYGKKAGKTKVTITTKGKNAWGNRIKKRITVSVKKKKTPVKKQNTKAPNRITSPTKSPISSTGGYTRGEWVEKLAKKLHFDSSNDFDEDLFYFADTMGKKYGINAELAHSYNLLPECDADGYEDPQQDLPYFEADKMITKEYAAYTVVKAIGFIDDSNLSLDCDDTRDLKYPLVDAIAVSQKITDLKNNRFYPNSILNKADADKMLSKIDVFQKSTEVDTSHNEEKIEYLDNVIQDDKINTEDYTIQNISNNEYRIKIASNNTTSALKADDVFVLPVQEKNSTQSAFKVESVERTTGGKIYLKCIKPEIEEVVTNLSFSGAGKVDKDNITAASGVEYKYIENEDLISDKSEKKKLPINVNGQTSLGKIEYTIGEKKITDNLKASGKVAVSIPEVKVKLDADVGLLSGVDFKEFLFSMKEKIEIKGDLKYTAAESGYELTNSNGETKFEAGNIELGRVPIQLGATGLSADIVFFFELNAKGNISIGYSMEATQGFQYINGSSRIIKDFSQSFDTLKISGSFKAGLGLEIALNAFNLMDLAGVQLSFGLGVSVSFTPHLDLNPHLYCGDGKLYLYGSLALSEETALGKFLSKVCKITISNDFWDEKTSPLMLKIHFENMNKVDKCTYAGIIEGIVKDSNGNSIMGAKVQIFKGGILLNSIYTDTEGKYHAQDLSAGQYTIKVFVTGYSAYETIENVQSGQTTYVETLIMLDRNENQGEGKVSGDIIDAVSGNLVDDVTYHVRKNWNNTSGDVIDTGTTSAHYTLRLHPGNYTVQFMASDYADSEINIAVTSNEELNKNVTMSPILTKNDGLMRIVLTWGEYPNDLDSHLIGPTLEGNNNFHVYFSSESYYTYDSKDDYIKIADLDLDDTTSYGPETITIHKSNTAGKYSYFVHDYSNKSTDNSNELSLSNAQVRVYQGTTLIQRFNVPANQEGTLWHVFDYDAATNKIIPINIMSYETDEDDIGK